MTSAEDVEIATPENVPDALGIFLGEANGGSDVSTDAVVRLVTTAAKANRAGEPMAMTPIVFLLRDLGQAGGELLKLAATAVGKTPDELVLSWHDYAGQDRGDDD